MTPLAFTLIICAYLIGSVSSAILLCRLFRLPDPREQGSKNPGTTNVLRIAGKNLAVLVLFLDVLKGFFTVWTVQLLSMPSWAISIAALAGFLGQLFPIFFKFRGGKGIAITLGIIAAFYWQLSLLLLLTWVLVFLIFRISSLAAISATIVAIISTFWLPNRDFAVCIMIISLLILFRHKQNIKNLFNKTECKIKIY
ncbi:MAG: glycerol-3-phosphate 1-O-acyltransferase PlsY [Gammaproteobacteria bacterium]